MKYPSRRPAKCSCTGKMYLSWDFHGFHQHHHHRTRNVSETLIESTRFGVRCEGACPAQSHTVKSTGPLPMAVETVETSGTSGTSGTSAWMHGKKKGWENGGWNCPSWSIDALFPGWNCGNGWLWNCPLPTCTAATDSDP